VDAGSHLAAITRILLNDFPYVSEGSRPRAASGASASSPYGDLSDDNGGSNTASERSASPEPIVLHSGPFKGASFPHKSARANAVHFVREHVEAYLITHPHLDHISGFAINTAAFHNTSRPKKLSALPFTVNAIKQHIFNDIIWPNLTDEEDGVGFVTFQRLTEGGNLALGEGHSRGFIEVCNGLAVKGFKVSHGTCASAPKPDRRGSRETLGLHQPQVPQGQQTPHHSHVAHNRSRTHSHGTPSLLSKLDNPASAGTDNVRRSSIFSQPSQPGTPTFFPGGGQEAPHHQNVVDSTAYFIRADASGREILIFGDVEPDAISACPRNHIIWGEAAPKIAAGLLSGIFIECSYNDSQSDNILFGHLAPRHLIAELQTLADMVAERKKELADKAGKKRKRISGHASSGRTRSSRENNPVPILSSGSNGTELMTDILHEEPGLNDASPVTPAPKDEGPLKGVRVVIIHVKDTMTDGPLVGESILEDLEAHEEKLREQGRHLGCVFEISKSGDSYYF
jgi:elongation factor 1-gamma